MCSAVCQTCVAVWSPCGWGDWRRAEPGAQTRSIDLDAGPDDPRVNPTKV